MENNYLLTKMQQIVANNIDNKLKDFPKYVIEIGVFENLPQNIVSRPDGKEIVNDTRKDYTEKTNKKGEKKKVKGDSISEITNSHIMFVMEYGSPLNDIPARPILHQTVEWAKQNLLQPTIKRGLKKYFQTNDIRLFEIELEKMCLDMEKYVNTGVRRKLFDIAPNAQSTIDAKGSDIPLLDTGQLVKSIRAVCKRI